MIEERITFLGTGDSMGVPRVYCECAVCEEARTTGQNRRYRSSVLIETAEGELLLDCGPDWKMQMEMIRNRSVERVLITHAHHDHVGGLPEWADACRWTGRKGGVYAPAPVFETVRRQYPWIDNHLTFAANDDGMEFGGWRITPWEVCHGKNGTSFAYLFEKNGYRWAYCSDAIHLTERQKEPLRRLNLLVLGTNFYKEEAAIRSRSVYDMTEACALLEQIEPDAVYFTHMSHGVDVNARYKLPANVVLARHGMSVRIGG